MRLLPNRGVPSSAGASLASLSHSKEQLTGVEQVNKAVSQMDRVTQGNASQTEEVSGTASALLSHAEQLQEQIGRFRLGNSDLVQRPKPRRTSNENRPTQKSNFRPSRDLDQRADFVFERASKGVSEMMEF